MSENYALDADIPMHHDGLGVAAPGMHASLSYESPRETATLSQGRSGDIESVDFDTGGQGTLTFYDEHRERRFRVTTGETFEDTRVESHPPEGEDGNSRIVGRIIRLSVHKNRRKALRDGTAIAEGAQADFPFVVASIEWNSKYFGSEPHQVEEEDE